MRIVQVAQRAEDLDRATAFYADLIGRVGKPLACYAPRWTHAGCVTVARRAPSMASLRRQATTPQNRSLRSRFRGDPGQEIARPSRRSRRPWIPQHGLGRLPSATYDPPGLVFFDLDGTRLLLERGAPTAVHYLAVDDIEATVTRLRDRGVTVEGEPHVIFRHTDETLGPAGTDEWQAFVRDSEGNLLGLVEQRRS